eukprot:scaffold1397_cov254-Pinguiococcus_pyrenoidosus.AAC.69
MFVSLGLRAAASHGRLSLVLDSLAVLLRLQGVSPRSSRRDRRLTLLEVSPGSGDGGSGGVLKALVVDVPVAGLWAVHASQSVAKHLFVPADILTLDTSTPSSVAAAAMASCTRMPLSSVGVVDDEAASRRRPVHVVSPILSRASLLLSKSLTRVWLLDSSGRRRWSSVLTSPSPASSPQLSPPSRRRVRRLLIFVRNRFNAF